MNELQVFQFDSEEVRTVVKDGEPWFIGADVCAVLGIGNNRDAMNRLDDDEKDAVGITDAIGREQVATAVNESGLYSLIMTSRKPEAKRFKRWVTAEVLPTIRKTGAYAVQSPELQLANAVLLAHKVIEDQKLLIADMAPKAEFFDAVTGSSTAVDMAVVAKTLNMGIGRNHLFEFLREKGILDRKNTPYQSFVDRGYFRIVESSYSKPDGSTHVNFKTVVFQKGLAYIRNLLAESGYSQVIKGVKA